MSSRIICPLAATMLSLFLPVCMSAGEGRTTALKTVYRGSAAAAAALNGTTARPLGLASADFNEDGYPDVVSAYEVSFGGALAIHYGAAAVPFQLEAHSVTVPERPDFIATGDFNGDDHFDIVVAARDSGKLFFLAGDGEGGFAEPVAIDLPGRITALVSGEVNRADGLADLAVAVSVRGGAQLLVFESPRGALNDNAETMSLPGEATELALRNSNETGFRDVVVQTSDATYLVRGRDRKLAIPEEVRGPIAKVVVERMPGLESIERQVPANGVVAALRVNSSGGGSVVELHAGSPALHVLNKISSVTVVNNNGNQGDGDLTDGVCDTGTASAHTGVCTLAAAIQQANQNGGSATITFSNSVTVITPGGVYPSLTVPAVVDGLSGRSQRVQLDGRNAFGGDQIYDPSGLGLYGGNSTATGLSIYGFVTGIKTALNGNNTIQNCLIGLDNTGTVPSGRTLIIGVLLESTSGNNLIGGTGAGQGNVISVGGANGDGIQIQSPANTVQGNLIGTDPTGTKLIGNLYPLTIGDASNNLVGGTTAGARNIIAGIANNSNCTSCGNIRINTSNAPSTGNMILGNYIGTDITGSIALGGANGGVYAGGANTTIGGTTAAARNVISGNGAFGVALPNPGAVLQGNYIGTTVTGNAALANGCCGVEVQNSGAMIGGSGAAGNVISGNSGPGLTFNQSYTSNVSVLGNIVGLNAAGTAALGNTGDGVAVVDISGSGHILGAPGTGNVISGNGGNGINTAAGSLTIQSNFIGTNAAGTAAIGNHLDGIAVNAAGGAGAKIGGTTANQRNLVSGNTGSGITVSASNPFMIQGNWVGTDVSGTNPLGNGAHGIRLLAGFIPGSCGSCSDYYGSVTGNTVAFNAQDGIDAEGAQLTTFQGNSIFANPTIGIALANGSNGGISAPLLTSANLSGGMLQVQGSIVNAPNGFPATLEFFNNNSTDSPAEGRHSIGTATVNATGDFTVSIAASSVSLLTATVTDHGGNTSMFSAGFRVGAAGTQPRDFAGNGRAGALLYDPSMGQAYTALSNGNGSYQYIPNLFTSGFDVLRTGDFNGDGKADLVVYNSHTALAYIGMGNGDGTFAFQSLFWSPGYNFVETGDLNGDGKTDVALYNNATGTMYTGISNGAGVFTYKYTLVSSGYTFVRLADFSGDGKADLFLYNANAGTAYLGIGDGTGGFAFHPLFISSGYNQVDIGDLNGDGKADLILYNSANGNAATGISDGVGGFTFASLLFSPGFTSVRLADYTGDGKADVTVYNANTAAAYFGTGNGAGNFSFQSLFWSPGYDSVIAGDVNADGKMDVMLYNSATGTEYTGISNGNGTFNYTYQLWGSGKVLAR